MPLSEVTNLSSAICSWLITPFLQCLFSRLKKYFVFFSPSLYHLHFDLKIALLVLCSIICSSSLYFFSNSLCISCFPGSSLELRSISFCSQFIVVSNSSSILDKLLCFVFAFIIDCSLTFSLIISQVRAALTVLSS